MRPPNVTGAAAEPRGDAVEAHAAGIEGDDAVQVFERVRERELAQAAVGQQRVAGDHRRASRCRVIRAVTSARPELRMSGRKPCSTARLAAPLACSASD